MFLKKHFEQTKILPLGTGDSNAKPWSAHKYVYANSLEWTNWHLSSAKLNNDHSVCFNRKIDDLRYKLEQISWKKSWAQNFSLTAFLEKLSKGLLLF